VGAWCFLAIFQPAAQADQDSSTASSRKTEKAVHWDLLGKKSDPSSGLQRSTVGPKVDWKAELSSTSRRGKTLTGTAGQVRPQVPWPQAGPSSLPVDSSNEPGENSSSRSATRAASPTNRLAVSSGQAIPKEPLVPSGLLPSGTVRQIPWESPHGLAEPTTQEISSRVAWSPSPVAAIPTVSAPTAVMPNFPAQISQLEASNSLIETLPTSSEPNPKAGPEIAMIEWPTVQQLGVGAPTAQEPAQLITEIPDPFRRDAHRRDAQPVAVHTPLQADRRPATEPTAVQPTLLPHAGTSQPTPPPSTLVPVQIAEQANDPRGVRATPGGTVDRWIDSVGDQPPTTPALLTSHSGVHGSNSSIRLGQIPVMETQTTSNGPIGVLPIARLTQSDTTRGVAAAFSTEKYTGPMASAEELFMNLHVSEEFETQPGEQLQAQRTSLDSVATSYTWMPGVYTWASPSFYHRPLYFEQANLERYGMGPQRCVQPFFSGMHFFSSIALMPYKLLTQHPYERVYSLGNQRPGDAACYQGRSLLGQSYVGEVCRYWDEHSGYQ